jgi:hypothetical protein
MWPAINMILAANPDAFVDQDVNRLMAGTELVIPNLADGAVANTAAQAAAPVNVVETNAADSVPATDLVGANEEPRVVETTSAFEVTVELPVAEPEVAIEPAAVTDTMPVVDVPVIAPPTELAEELRPGDVIMPAAGTTGTGITLPDNGAAEPQPAVIPIVSTSSPVDSDASGAWTWLALLAGSGIAIIAGLLLFGRRVRERFSPADAAAPTPSVEKPNIVSDVDFEFDDTISAEAISLDADLEAGTGLNAGAQIDVAEDFGFTANGQAESELDLEITEGAAGDPEESPTDIIAPNHREDTPTILDAEETPSAEGDYDMSMIVDATKQSLDQYDATAKDLQAVQIDPTDSDVSSGGYTMNSEVDFQVLEQDYEEEFTATMAANAEIERVALELANRMDDEEVLEVTREMPVKDSAGDNASDEDMTVKMPPQQASDITAELATNVPEAGEAENDSTVEEVEDLFERTAAGSDITVDLNVQSGKVDTKKK